MCVRFREHLGRSFRNPLKRHLELRQFRTHPVTKTRALCPQSKEGVKALESISQLLRLPIADHITQPVQYRTSAPYSCTSSCCKAFSTACSPSVPTGSRFSRLVKYYR